MNYYKGWQSKCMQIYFKSFIKLSEVSTYKLSFCPITKCFFLFSKCRQLVKITYKLSFCPITKCFFLFSKCRQLVKITTLLHCLTFLYKIRFFSLCKASLCKLQWGVHKMCCSNITMSNKSRYPYLYIFCF